MHLRVVLRTPGGDTVIRDTLDGRWAEPWGVPDETTSSGWWALPGLIDAHAHIARPAMDFQPGDIQETGIRANDALKAGVGLILDKGWGDLTVVHMLDEVPPEERPDIEAAGMILTVEGGFWDGFGRAIDPRRIGEEAARAATEGRGWVKLIGDWPRKGIGPQANFSEAELTEAVAAARANGARVAVHTMARGVPAMAVRAGVDSIEHGLFLSPGDLDALGQRGGSWVPTVVQVEAVIAQLGERSSGGRLLLEGLDLVVANLNIAVEAGVHVLTGTDLAIATREVAREAVRLWEMGMAPPAVLDAVSWSGFRATGREDPFAVGAPASAVLYDEDPVVDPGVLLHPSRVIRMGRVVA
jgi:imidazolonepropionase-like amidohydrolase